MTAAPIGLVGSERRSTENGTCHVAERVPRRCCGEWFGRVRADLRDGSPVAHITAITYTKADGTLIGDLTYEYDENGRTTSVDGSLARLGLPTADVTDAVYDANNRLVTWGGRTYSYDNNGNLINDGVNSYHWNERNWLQSISNGPSELASFQYDSRGRRISKTIGGQTTGFLYDGSNITQELDGVSATAAVKAHLLTGSIDETFLRIDGNDGTSRNSSVSDANNNVIMTLDAAQSAATSYTYTPYGSTATDVASSNAQQFSSRENDNLGIEQGLYCYRARYYMPGIARFISEDPIGWASGQVNNYAYLGGNPINFIDPSGLGFWDNLTNFSAGFGDAISFGLTRWIRQQIGVDGVVNPCSGWYGAGEIAGTVVQAIATDGLLGAEEAAGEEVVQNSFEIVDGVRRAKAAEIAEQATIRAQIGGVGEIIEVPLDSLHSPFKAAIDVTSSPAAMSRWESVLEATRAGEELPPIHIQPGSRGPLLSDIFFE